jgi:hypothetical protein
MVSQKIPKFLLHFPDFFPNSCETSNFKSLAYYTMVHFNTINVYKIKNAGFFVLWCTNDWSNTLRLKYSNSSKN